MVGYRVPKEWATLTEPQRGVGSLAAFKRRSREGFLAVYGVFVCSDGQCWVCDNLGGWLRCRWWMVATEEVS